MYEHLYWLAHTEYPRVTTQSTSKSVHTYSVTHSNIYTS